MNGTVYTYYQEVSCCLDPKNTDSCMVYSAADELQFTVFAIYENFDTNTTIPGTWNNSAGNFLQYGGVVAFGSVVLIEADNSFMGSWSTNTDSSGLA